MSISTNGTGQQRDLTACSDHAEKDWTLYDAVHGMVTYPPFVREVVDTCEFQRLRNLKQLGTSTKVFPCATHTRFEHCLGVCHLAGKLLKTLEKNSGVQVSNIHRKCVVLAALLHDVGHGPFSHMWEDFVHSGSDKSWSHEQSSCEMAYQLFANNDIKLSPEELEHFYGQQLICALITGNQEALTALLTPDTMFLAEIVHNKWYKIDVDKWDYLLRDSFYLGGVVQIQTGFVRLFENARVVRDAEGVSHIGYRKSDYGSIVQLFEARTKLHIECYQHPTILGLEKLLIEALQQAEESGFRLKGTKISEAHHTPSVYQYLDDTVVNQIEVSDNPNLLKAQQLFTKIRQRKFYQQIYVSEQECDIIDLNRRLGGDFFFQIHKKIPYGSEMAPRNMMLYDERSGDLVDNRRIVEDVLNSINQKGYFQQFIVYCKSTEPKVIKSAREYLMARHSAGTN
ncbi:deoxynucleoside triphosphate triphosphohydrolase SAMHD1 [Uranotaenia lowii]|uniref:deoxynucleoside triphosphate triphosphohydrolase SAMHD1 n=1 Tax=Uranotaenia lowii TaxID=190385 RepID=UPI002478B4E6|nr:deoxynucleoside triphosphate triphosphohydrolase SAMHD1 [Uranotaenia lowii]XP_055609658.1 deoxynucleoside triphosphate triphosphohydrolase SAMHD1 [Uranotaenia lowii]